MNLQQFIKKDMTQENKELLSKDLCGRLPYEVKCYVPVENCIMKLTGKRLNYFCFHKKEWGIDYSHEFEVVLDPLNDAHNGYIVKPYLRPMSSMTEEEEIEYDATFATIKLADGHYDSTMTYKSFDWLNAHHFDYRGLIPKGLAIEVTKENNPYKE